MLAVMMVAMSAFRLTESLDGLMVVQMEQPMVVWLDD